jgi:DNA-binding transcriptional ArsR family regulator
LRGDADVAAAAALLAEPARAALVLAVMDEGTLPASALAARAVIAPSTASEHLARLVAGGFLARTRRGRHRYYRLADAAVAAAVEALALVAPQPPVRSLREATRSELIRYGRTCYDHLAGHVGNAVAHGLERQRVVVRQEDNYVLGPRAEAWLASLGIDLRELQRQRRSLVRGCLDWSELELHVAGALGAALTARLFELDWIRRREVNRSIKLTEQGRAFLQSELGVEMAVERATVGRAGKETAVTAAEHEHRFARLPRRRTLERACPPDHVAVA